MMREDVDKLLTEYREAVGRCAHLENEIYEAEKALEAMKQTMRGTSCFRGTSYEGMPHGSTVSDPTADIAIDFAEGRMPPDVRDAEKELIAMRVEYAEKQWIVRRVKAWLSGLSERESWIITAHVIEEVAWSEVVPLYCKRYGYTYSRDSLKRLKARAMGKLYKIAH